MGPGQAGDHNRDGDQAADDGDHNGATNKRSLGHGEISLDLGVREVNGSNDWLLAQWPTASRQVVSSP